MREFRVVDVFTATPFRGNPVAVVLDADGMSGEEMQRVAGWTNLSETTFCLPPTTPEADYRLRIFTPVSELPFAGHPTLGSLHALLEAGLAPRDPGVAVQECGAGLVPVRIDRAAGTLCLRMPQPRLRDLTEAETARLAGVLGAPLAGGCRPALVDVGVRWVVAELASAEALIALRPDMAACAAFERDLGADGVTLFGRHGAGEDIEVRSFAPSSGMAEDPVCGSGNGSVAIFRRARGLIAAEAEYAATQGRCLGRAGHISLQVSGGEVYVGGQAVTTVKGEIAID
ncbi:PhzF family phenazine biosynthesis protein [Oceanicella sp. SM1341]|uniref:PhzF family phenazine biosynthesis protein n=1 Tax=Oceanicella sp. SM1341 TaxID=1548889 RepID=UPI000E469B33|nr:PhzF family phenazine biosynthesis protein [Oceanicella sp. SM1341]